MDELIIQICQVYNPLNLIDLLFKVIMMIIERRSAINPTTTRTH